MTSNKHGYSAEALFGQRLEASANRLAEAGMWTAERDQRCVALVAASRAAGDRARAARAEMSERPRNRTLIERFMSASRAHMRSIAGVLEVCGRDCAAVLYRQIADYPTASVDEYLAHQCACVVLADDLAE